MCLTLLIVLIMLLLLPLRFDGVSGDVAAVVVVVILLLLWSLSLSGLKLLFDVTVNICVACIAVDVIAMKVAAIVVAASGYIVVDVVVRSTCLL